MKPSSTNIPTAHKWITVLAILAAVVAGLASRRGDFWFLPALAVAGGIAAQWVWHRKWSTDRVELAERHDEMIERAHMFSWEVENHSGIILSMTGNVEGTLGYTADELVGQHVSVVIDIARERKILRDDLAKAVEAERHSIVTAIHRDGTRLILREVRLASRQQGVVRGVSFDITELAEATEALRYQAQHDALTGLANRTVLEETITDALDAEPVQTALFMADLDRFKEVNDTLGHPTGDRLLQVLADRLTNGLDDLDVVARLGGDEFAFVAVAPGDRDEVERIAVRIHDLITTTAEVDGLQLAMGCSIGVAVSPDHGDSYTELLKRADIATYQAKRTGGGFVVFEAARDELSVQRLRLTSEIDAALKTEQFRLYFQPQVDLVTGAIVGVEGLARWRHPELGLLLPEEFFPSIEVSADSKRFNTEMLRQGIAFVADAQSSGHTVQVAMNLSAMSLHDRELPDTIRALLDHHRVPAANLTIEVVESDLIDERDMRVFGELSKLGVQLSIDDFGTGHSNFTRLRALDVDAIKIDQAFVQGVGMEAEDMAIVLTTLQLAELLGLNVVAEGVETIDQLEHLQRMGCHTAQGFLWSEAVHRDDMLALLDADTTFDVGETQGADPGHTQPVEVHVSILDQRATAG